MRETIKASILVECSFENMQETTTHTKQKKNGKQ